MALSTTTTILKCLLPANEPTSILIPSISTKPTFINLSTNKPLLLLKLNERNVFKTRVSFLPSFFSNKTKNVKVLKEELLEAIEPLDRGADATPEDQQMIDQLTRKLEAVNPTKEPLKSDLLNGKWELVYTTSTSILQTQRYFVLLKGRINLNTNYFLQFITKGIVVDTMPLTVCHRRPKFLRSKVNYQAINADTLRAQNMESGPFFNQVTADLTPVNSKKVAVKFDYFKIGGLIPVKAPDSARGSLEITYLDEDLRVSRGDKGNLFILKMVDRSYRIPSK